MKKKVLVLSNHFLTLYSFRKELIKELIQRGYCVCLSLPVDLRNKYFRDIGCDIIETSIDRRGINPINDLRLLIKYFHIIKEYKPDIICSYTIKPNIYGSIASNILHYKQICNITGTGATFLHESWISKIAKVLYKCSVKRACKVYFQNTGDRDYFIKHHLIGNNYELLPGSGVNLDEHTYSILPDGKYTNFIFIGRVMKLKGIDLFLECAKKIKSKYPDTNFYIAGFIEEERYKKIIERYENDGYIKYLGFQQNIDQWIKICSCIILTSFGGEGIPNVLLEAAANGRVCIASDISGNSDVISDGKTGFLFNNGDCNDLIKKVESFILLPLQDKINMGKEARNKVVAEFDRNIVIETYLNEIEIQARK